MASVVAATTTTQSPQSASSRKQPCCPLYDWFLDIPHPMASKSFCNPKPFLIPSPIVPNPVGDEIQTILPQIARFAFPEYDETLSQQQQQQSPQSSNGNSASESLNKYDLYAMQNEAFSQFTFSLQLQNGMRVHGHVRRYLPPHMTARTRFDVGRRGERALVLLTRATGADLLYSSILKSIEAISSQQAALSVMGQTLHDGNPQQWFLHQLCRYQNHLCNVYGQQPETERGKPLIASISGLEFGNNHEIVRDKYKDTDMHRYIIPVSLLLSTQHEPTNANNTSARPPSFSPGAAGSIVPLLRCVGVAHALRIMAALLSERRVILVSNSPTRLAVCCNAAVSMLAVGLLHWQHLYIPVLPPHMWQYLAAPYPYLIGILASTVPRLDRTDGLGEVLMIQLDTNQMETRGMESSTILQRLPDLFRFVADQVQQQMPYSTSASETLAQDLFEILKQDKKVLYGESTFNKVGETAAIATKVVKNTFFKLRDKGRQYLQQRTNGGLVEDASSPAEPTTAEENDAPVETNSMASDYIYTEGCHNEVAEQETRIAFTMFFLCMFGDMRWYVSTTPTGPVLDRAKFLQQKRSMGDVEGTPMLALLNNVCQTQMLEEFAKARIEEIRTRSQITVDMPLFLQCAAECRQKNLNFEPVTIQRVTRQIADGSPARLTGLLQTNARRTAMTLTSNKAYEGDYSHSIAQLVDQCRECTSILFDVMSVIWLRLRDCRGMQWKHGYQALQILRNLLYHGPLAAITEATDGLSKIRAMKYYENMRSQSTDMIRSAAATIYNLLVDRAKLFQIRRVCAERRRLLQSKNEPKRIREGNTRIGVPLRNLHALMHPNASRGTVVPIPPKAPTSQTMTRGNATPPHPAPTQVAQTSDLLDVGNASPDLVGLFGNIQVTSTGGGVNPSGGSNANPFDAFAPTNPSPTTNSAQAQTQPPQTQQQLQHQMPPNQNPMGNPQMPGQPVGYQHPHQATMGFHPQQPHAPKQQGQPFHPGNQIGHQQMQPLPQNQAFRPGNLPPAAGNQLQQPFAQPPIPPGRAPNPGGGGPMMHPHQTLSPALPTGQHALQQGYAPQHAQATPHAVPGGYPPQPMPMPGQPGVIPSQSQFPVHHNSPPQHQQHQGNFAQQQQTQQPNVSQFDPFAKR